VLCAESSSSFVTKGSRLSADLSANVSVVLSQCHDLVGVEGVT
jgi:hypothetical protein